MFTRAARLGDDIDDYCVKCKRVMTHSVVSILKDEPAKVRCRTCHNDHDFRHEQPPPPKIDPRKAALFNEVLATMPNQTPDVNAPKAAAGDEPAAVGAAAEPKPRARKKAKA